MHAASRRWINVPQSLRVRVQTFMPWCMRTARPFGALNDLVTSGWLNAAEGNNGRVFVSDFHKHRVYVLQPSGKLEAMWGTLGDGPGKLMQPFGLAVARDTNEVVVADWGNNRVQVFHLDGSYIRHWGGRGTNPGQFRRPQGVALMKGHDGETEVVVTEWCNHRVQVFRLSDGTFLRQWGGCGSHLGAFNDAAGVCVSVVAASGPQVIVADYMNDRVQVFCGDGTFLRAWGTRGTKPGQFNQPLGVTARGLEVWVADEHNHRVQAFRLVDGAFLSSMCSSASNGETIGVLAKTTDDSVLVTGSFRASGFIRQFL